MLDTDTETIEDTDKRTIWHRYRNNVIKIQRLC